MFPDDEDDEGVVSPVLTPSPLSRWTITAGVLAVTGEAIQHAAAALNTAGQLVADIGTACAHHWVAQQERRAFEAAVVTEIEKITTEG